MIRDNSGRGQQALYGFMGLGLLLIASAILQAIYCFLLGTSEPDSTAVEGMLRW